MRKYPILPCPSSVRCSSSSFSQCECIPAVFYPANAIIQSQAQNRFSFLFFGCKDETWTNSFQISMALRARLRSLRWNLKLWLIQLLTFVDIGVHEQDDELDLWNHRALEVSDLCMPKSNKTEIREPQTGENLMRSIFSFRRRRRSFVSLSSSLDPIR